MTAAVALLTGMSAARADELADLRANQQLLQQRVDQLAQATAPSAVPQVPGGLYGGGPANPAASAPSLGGSFPRSFLIPGTDTSIRIGGQITEVVDYWLSGGNPNSSPQSTTVGDNGQALSTPLDLHGQFVPGTPVPGAAAFGTGGNGIALPPTGNPHSRGNGIFWTSPRESKVNFETRTPTPYGEARTFMEFDWAGSTQFAPGGANPTSVSDNLHPRLRYAYGTLGGFLAGQANSNFSDPDANAEVLDFGGNVGEPGVVRVPQIRYTIPITWGWGGAFSVSAETPETDIFTPVGQTASDAGASFAAAGAGAPTGLVPNPAKAGAPDLTFAYYVPQPWGHLDFSIVVRPTLQIQDGHFIDQTYQGYGGHFGFDVKPRWFGWEKDDITFHFVAGDGIGRYLNCSCNSGLVTNFVTAPTTVAAARSIVTKTITEFGGEMGYQHWWAPNLRSTISGGINHADINSNTLGPAQDAAVNKEIITAHANLIWSPVSFVDFGIEYMYGHRQTVANLKGDENVLISKMAFRF
ncbi:MAG TPA: DcaP family trimeric outer membrane transporter [Stellaceae bacterium]|nr:DcaP family trimeric outer membrane transporter [Stellaceae bacterium]